DHQRRGNASAGQLPWRTHALSRFGYRPRFGADRGWGAGADGTGALALQEGPELRRLRRIGRTETSGEKEMAPACARRRQATEDRVAGRLRRAGRRECQTAEE